MDSTAVHEMETHTMSGASVKAVNAGVEIHHWPCSRDRMSSLVDCKANTRSLVYAGRTMRFRSSSRDCGDADYKALACRKKKKKDPLKLFCCCGFSFGCLLVGWLVGFGLFFKTGLCSSCYPGIHYVDQASLILIDVCLPLKCWD